MTHENATRHSLTLPRRELLVAGSALAAAPLAAAVPRWTAGQPEPVRVGVVGIGIRGRRLMDGKLLASESFRVTAVCDVDETRMLDAKRRVDERYGDDACQAVPRHEDLVKRDDVDAVLIATPDHWHTHQILDACAAGKDVYCEKPLTLTLRESQVVIDAVRRAGIVFQTGSQQRSEYGHRFVAAAEAVRAGRIGRVLTVHVGVGDPPSACDLGGDEVEPGLDWDRWLGPAPMRAYSETLSPRGVHGHYPQWRRYWEYAGGGLADMGAHHFDIAQWALGMDGSLPVRVDPPAARGALRGATALYANGVRLVHGGPSGATFIGEKGTIAVDRGRISSTPDKILEWEPTDEERFPRHAGHVENWLECIRDRSEPVCGVEVGARSAAVCHLMNACYREGRTLDFNPGEWRFTGYAPPNERLDVERREGYGLPT
ncbi:MAG: Gfo/Idh/MocA family oxidoreductase [Planctomycetota bacterium]